MGEMAYSNLAFGVRDIIYDSVSEQDGLPELKIRDFALRPSRSVP